MTADGREVEPCRLVIPPQDYGPAIPFVPRLVLLVVERNGIYRAWTATLESMN